ncbi:flagellar protein FliO/FliZ [Pseudobutyrivibrio sp. YE44]|uniref:flagellar biosynthetic protein FliO n=1 Tax=Pseudobutyrivibrio sp. YE44 TaxID=1520802 RepID=UPI00088DBF16|nr:flagellar biosynthetic protein FliO [Pseudobutyrivibrio sp. YE44]SDB11170.1 flagellar protein FliO/FliZ [Pseudobutyrivibrio sp. YE44]
MALLSSAGESFFQLIFILVVFVGVLALTYYVTKWIAGYQKTQGLNKNLEIIEAIRISSNKYVQIIRAGSDRYFVVAIGKDEVVPLGEISADQLIEIGEYDSSQIKTVDFKSILDKISKKK